MAAIIKYVVFGWITTCIVCWFLVAAGVIPEKDDED